MNEPTHLLRWPKGAELSLGRVVELERAYFQLPGWARTPAMRRDWFIECLREIQWACECHAYKRVSAGHATFSDLLPVSFCGELIDEVCRRAPEGTLSRTRDRLYAQARAAAILDLATTWGGREIRWAEKIAAVLSAAGLGGGKNRGTSKTRTGGKRNNEIDASTVKKWLARCRAGSHGDVGTYLFAQSMIAHTFRLIEPADRAQVLLNELAMMGAHVALRFGAEESRQVDTESRKHIDQFCQAVFGRALSDDELVDRGVML